ncbi:MAG: rhodanese-related sulfurtransferase [Endozoicomonadaceae bacterium]|nr:rhodanese-related sulfurtransferase [Endozoicomonadaceae bacterium]
MGWVIASLYQFTTLEDWKGLYEPLLFFMKEQGIKGTILLAREGVNGTVCGARDSIDQLKQWFAQDARFQNLEYKESVSNQPVFYRTKVKLKKEIVTLGIDDVDPAKNAGIYVEPHHWNQLILDSNVTVLDTRNHYEVKIGSFQGAISANTNNFREFPQFVEKKLDRKQHKKIAMFCTGGIRCEKSTAYLKKQGFESVYHLKGGILKYLEVIPEDDSLWQGECFVFDQRVAVNHGLSRGQYDQCYACRTPITQQDQVMDTYQKGISCPYCYDQLDDHQRQRFKEREKQIALSLKRGKRHIGDEF